jgi:hypothetical protein
VSGYRICYSCGSRSTETRFPQDKIGRLHLCLDCALEWASEEARRRRWVERQAAIVAGTWPLVRRASVRAAVRARARLAQPDMLDLVMRVP